METQNNNNPIIKALEDEMRVLKELVDTQTKVIGIKETQLYLFQEKIKDLKFYYQEKIDELEFKVTNLYCGFPRSN